MLLDETEDGYTRHRGARELLEIIQQLTRPSFVHRPFDAAMTQHLERKFFWVIDDLEELGYEVSPRPNVMITLDKETNPELSR